MYFQTHRQETKICWIQHSFQVFLLWCMTLLLRLWQKNFYDSLKVFRSTLNTPDNWFYFKTTYLKMLSGRIQRTWMRRRENRNIWVRFSWLIKNFSSLDMRETPSLAIFILLQQVKSCKISFENGAECKFIHRYHGGFSISIKLYLNHQWKISRAHLSLLLSMLTMLSVLSWVSWSASMLAELEVLFIPTLSMMDSTHQTRHKRYRLVTTGTLSLKVNLKTLGPKKSGEESF